MQFSLVPRKVHRTSDFAISFVAAAGKAKLYVNAKIKFTVVAFFSQDVSCKKNILAAPTL